MRSKSRHIILTLKCLYCGQSFTRRRTRCKSEINERCRQCKSANGHKIKFWSTSKLKEVIELEGSSAVGTDYFQYMKEIKDVYYDRVRTIEDREMSEYLEHKESDIPF